MMPEKVDKTFVRFHEVPGCDQEVGVRGPETIPCGEIAVVCVEWADGSMWFCPKHWRDVRGVVKADIDDPHSDVYEYDFRDIPRPPYRVVEAAL